MRQGRWVLVLLCLTAPCFCDIPKPDVPKVFSSAVRYLAVEGSRHPTSSYGQFHYNVPEKMLAYSFSYGPISKKYPLAFQNVNSKDNSWIVINDVCWDGISAGTLTAAKDWFGWVSSSSTKFEGYEFFEDKNTTKWSLKNDHVDLSCNLLVTEPNFPVRFSSRSNGFPFGMGFTNHTLGGVSPALPPTCSQEEYDYVCPQQNPPVQQVLMMRLHGEAEYPIAESNLGDFLGDLYFMCAALEMNATVTDGSSLASLFLIEVDTEFGLYSYCNFYKCLGGSKTRVGRESPSGLLGKAGQCGDNVGVGMWYSLPKAAECADGMSVGDNDCAWREVKRIKSLSVDCLVKAGFVDRCKEDQGLPFEKTTEFIKKEFLSYDSICPDVPPSIE